ncbi:MULTISPECIES: hypothetical protein [unclassified Lactococcus]|uniref:hypothetical protein n=1 Tax=unclassified Lactococcus TaxID=2643510 RepID=UPI0011CBAA94|nr:MULTISPECIES: hypothetical protein [unclassified Lactococcus]MQW23255.1 hypothetical protein [Lactococcus sp. dk101]TXK38077.1 hypothetical protein FVP42_06605 [Lactococcus sp. dk310]TXK49756.1 hypothetical protein FVP43_06575 [Lactococcus sp. dk322]
MIVFKLISKNGNTLNFEVQDDFELFDISVDYETGEITMKDNISQKTKKWIYKVFGDIKPESKYPDRFVIGWN